MVTDMKRSWGIENYKNLTQKLSGNYKILLIGSPNENRELKYVSGNLKNVYIVTPSLKYTPSVINACRIFIGNHSGLSHIALKIGKPMVAIVDGGYFNWYFPLYNNNPENVFIFNKLECFECDWNCIFQEPYCLTKIPLEKVLLNLNKLINLNTNRKNA